MEKIIIVLALALCFASCEVAQVEPYSNGANIYIYQLDSTSTVPRDTTYYTLRSSYTDFLDISILVQLQGNISDLDRTYSLIVDPEQTTAIEGQDYTILNEDFTIPAGGYTDTIHIRLNDNETLANTAKIIRLRLESNENFSTDYQWYFSGGDPAVSRIQHAVYFGDIALEPAYWSTHESSIFGSFSGAKVDLLVEIGGLIEQLIYTLNGATPYTTSELTSAAHAVQLYLNEQEEMGNIILDEYGEPMVMGTSAR